MNSVKTRTPQFARSISVPRSILVIWNTSPGHGCSLVSSAALAVRQCQTNSVCMSDHLSLCLMMTQRGLTIWSWRLRSVSEVLHNFKHVAYDRKASVPDSLMCIQMITLGPEAPVSRLAQLYRQPSLSGSIGLPPPPIHMSPGEVIRDGMDRDGGSGGSRGGDDGSKGDECAGGAVHLARRSPAEGGDSEIGGDGDRVVSQASDVLNLCLWWKGYGSLRPDGNPSPNSNVSGGWWYNRLCSLRRKTGSSADAQQVHPLSHLPRTPLDPYRDRLSNWNPVISLWCDSTRGNGCSSGTKKLMVILQWYLLGIYRLWHVVRVMCMYEHRLTLILILRKLAVYVDFMELGIKSGGWWGLMACSGSPVVSLYDERGNASLRYLLISAPQKALRLSGRLVVVGCVGYN
ncbi:hypothetical protein Tco_1005209 [Tanacetum coccineum]|uniref:Uncharacterized protein n=1 Tax=Tanacetum coccineum TaxID=301880 RepID=A0ABQ5FEG1_9ASTR